MFYVNWGWTVERNFENLIRIVFIIICNTNTPVTPTKLETRRPRILNTPTRERLCSKSAATSPNDTLPEVAALRIISRETIPKSVQDWMRVIWTDEAAFYVGGFCGNVCVTRGSEIFNS